MAASAPQFEVYENADGWNWRLRAINGSVVAQGTQGYHHRGDCVAMQEQVARMLDDSDVETVDAP